MNYRLVVHPNNPLSYHVVNGGNQSVAECFHRSNATLIVDALNDRQNLRDALNAVQWVPHYIPGRPRYCAHCAQEERHGHDTGCVVGDALAKVQS